MPGRAARANDAWEAMLAAHATLIKGFAAEGIWGEISMREYDVLYTLSKSPSPIRQVVLHRHVLLSQPALSRMVERLVGRGLVHREGDPVDARGILLSLTPEGSRAQRRVGRRHARSVAASMTAGLTDAELIQLESLCRRLIPDT